MRRKHFVTEDADVMSNALYDFRRHSNVELARYAQAGLTPREALLTATRNSGRFLGRGELADGITWRRKADLVLLDANPLLDIGAIRRIHAVVAYGRLFDRGMLDSLRRDIERRAAQ
jgi:imidazolonepropionase-like amidohydrolase